MDDGADAREPGSWSFWHGVRRFMRVVVPLAFIAFTVWNLIAIIDEDPADTDKDITTTAESGTQLEPEPEKREITIAAVGDIGSGENGQATLAAMAKADPDLHLALGDLSYAGLGSEDDWCDLVRSTVGAKVPFQIVAGNHEEDTGEDGRIANFEKCLPDRLNSVGRYGREYYFDIGNLARVILISPDLTIENEHYFYGENNANQLWLETAIDGAREGGIKWVIVGMHKNCISVGEYYCNVYQELFSLLIGKKVDLVLHGHDHTYQRSKQLAVRTGCTEVTIDSFDEDCIVDDGSDGKHTQGRGPIFVVTGAGGGNLYDLNPDDPEAGYFATTMGLNRNGRHGYLSITLSESRLHGEFVGSTDGDFSDEFEVARPD